LEWALLGLVALVCGGLSYLQYRWTGELGTAQRSRSHGDLERQVRRIAQAFDSEVASAIQELVPDAGEIEAAGWVQAHRARFHGWQAGRAARICSRVAVVRGAALELYVPDAAGQPVASAWPSQWEPLRTRLEGGASPAVREDSELIAEPVRDRGEREWLVCEVNRAFLRNELFPRYAKEYLNPGPEPDFEMSVSRSREDGGVLYSTRADGASVLPGADITAGLFGGEPARSERRDRELRDPGRFLEGRRASRWVLAIRHRTGSLDAAVQRARARNLGISFVLVGLLAVAAVLLVRFTARSRRLSEMQFRFAAGVSHDLRTPLTAIRGAAFNMANGLVKDPAAMAPYADLILRNAQELSSMVENILAYTTTLDGDRPVAREPVVVSAVLERTAATFQSELQAAGCSLELSMEPGLPAILGDEMAVERAFRNLVGNAVRHASEGRWIGVTAARVDDGVEIRVRDRGPGIPTDEQVRIFEPFHRGERTKEKRIGGTGLGLSLVRTTVARHGGTVTLWSRPGEGAEFRVWLPGAVPAL
jgi:signal transduction histidine kinase